MTNTVENDAALGPDRPRCDHCGGPATHQGRAFPGGGSFPVLGCKPCLEGLSRDMPVEVAPISEALSPTLEKVQEVAARAVHKHPDLNRKQRADALFVILGERDASVERVAQFMRWADAYQERAVEVATEVAYQTCVTPSGEGQGR